MRFIVSLTTAAAFLLHMWLGCCAHHAHPAEGTTCHRHAVETYGHSHAGHLNFDHGHDSQTPCHKSSEDAPCPAECCTGGHCVFLAVVKIELAKLTLVAVLPVSTDDDIASVSEARSVDGIDTGGAIARPVRLHLFHQVILI